MRERSVYEHVSHGPNMYRIQWAVEDQRRPIASSSHTHYPRRIFNKSLKYGFGWRTAFPQDLKRPMHRHSGLLWSGNGVVWHSIRSRQISHNTNRATVTCRVSSSGIRTYDLWCDKCLVHLTTGIWRKYMRTGFWAEIQQFNSRMWKTKIYPYITNTTTEEVVCTVQKRSKFRRNP